jgi:hypothetical protein
MARFIATFVCVGLCGSSAFADPTAVPPGAVVFFAQGAKCPDGYQPAGYATGRLVLAVANGVLVGALVGVPLADREDRMHSHAFNLAGSLPSKSISGASGGSGVAAHSQDYSTSGATAAAASGLPFVQFPVCEKQ